MNVERVFVDTGVWYALNDRKDPGHVRAIEAYDANTLPLVTSNAVIWETITLLRYHVDHRQAMRFGEEIFGNQDVTIAWATREDEQEAWRIFKRYSDQKFGFTDCLSFAVMQRFSCHRALAFDPDFPTMGFITTPGPKRN